MKFYFFSFFFCLAFNVFAQHDNKTQFNVSPPSPVASKFSLYLDNAPNLSNGAVNIPVDIFEIKLKNLSIPMKLIYSTSGISITDSPFPYGYGWTLNLNPRVTRKVLGRADERFPFKDIVTYEDDWITRNDKPAFVGTIYYYPLLKGIITEYTDLSLYQLSREDLYDGQKDIFSINLPHKSISFVLKKVAGKFIAYTFGNYVKIEIINNIHGIYDFIDEIKVTDEDGTIYKFGSAVEADRVGYQENTLQSITTSWLLREIETIYKEKIYFTWDKFNTSSSGPMITNSSVVNDLKNRMIMDTGQPSSYPEVSISDTKISMSEFANPDSKMLTKIDFPLGSLSFQYMDLYKPLVNNIRVTNSNGTSIKNVDLMYGESNTNQDHFLLQGVNVNDEKYKFVYNTNRYAKTSKSLDFWGLYNGAVNQSHIPKVYLKYFWDYAFNYPTPINNGLIVGSANKSVDVNLMKAFMLEKVIYPTGGYSVFEYEPHQFVFNEDYAGFELGMYTPSTPSTGGGLRVNSIKNFDHDGTLQTEKLYKYGIGENGLARIKLVPTLCTFVDEVYNFQYQSTQTVSTRMLTIKSLSDYSSYDFGKSGFWYDEVSEYSSTNKKTVKFIFKDDEATLLQSTRTFRKRFTNKVTTLFQNGPEIREEINYLKTDVGYLPIEKKIYDYEWISDSTNFIKNLLIDRRIVSSLEEFRGSEGIDAIFPASLPFTGIHQNQLFPSNFNSGDFTFNYGYYYIEPGIYRLKNEKVINYEKGDSIFVERTIKYDLSKITYPNRIDYTASKVGLSNKTTFKYPWESNVTVTNLMTQMNMLKDPIEILFETNQSLTWSKNNYFIQQFPLYKTVLLQNQEVLTNNIINSSINFAQYDVFGNPREVKLQQKPSTIYLWGYSGQYPIAEIKNATYAEIELVLTKATIDGLNSPTVSESQIISAVNKLRNDIRLSKAMIISYTYNPLIGMTSKTDERGISEYYHYDSKQRLEAILDDVKDVTRAIDYHYRPN